MGALAFRTVVPAFYGAALMAHKFSAAGSPSPWMLAAVGGFVLHFLWRIHALVTRPQVQEIERVEVGLLAMLALATVLGLTVPPFPWPTAAYGVLLVALSGSVPLPGILALPIATVFTGGPGAGWLPDLLAWLPSLVNLELLALASGAVVAAEKRRMKRAEFSLKKLRRDVGDLERRAEEGSSSKRSDFSRLDDVLYGTLQDLKENAAAHGAILALKAPKSALFIRELVTDSHSIREQKVFDLDGTAFQWILRNRKHLLAGHLQDPGKRLGYYSGNIPVKSFVGVPLSDDDAEEPEGVLGLDSLREEAFSDTQVTMLKMASRQVSTILRQIGALEQQKRKARDYESLHEFAKRLGTCTTTADLLDLVVTAIGERIEPDLSAVVLAQPGGGLAIEAAGPPEWASLRGQTFDPQEGLAGWVLNSRTYLRYRDSRNPARRPLFSRGLKTPEFESLLLNPLEAHGDVLGVLCVGSASPKAFDDSAVLYCEFLAQQTAQMILEMKHLSQLELLAATDELTGLANRRVFFDRLAGEMKRGRRYPQAAALIILDVDHFKKINDRFGHPAGDETLRGVAISLGRFARETDFVARYGGEEFALLLPNTDETGARAVGERIREGIEKLQIEWEGKAISIQVSVGVTAVEGEADSADAMVSRADRALYAAKETGRNRVIAFSEIREYESWK